MLSEEAHGLSELIRVIIFTKNDEERNRAVEEFNNRIQNPDSIFSLFAVISGAQEKSIRQYSIIAIKIIIPSIVPVLSPEQLQQVKSLIIQALTSEPEFLLRQNICQAICNFPSGSWPEVIDLANQLLENPQLYTTGLYLWQFICDTIQEDQQPQAAPFLIETSKNAMMSPDPDARIYGIQLMNQSLYLKYDYSQSIEMIIATFQNTLQNAFYDNKNEGEARAISELLSDQLTDSKKFFESYIGTFAQWAIQTISNAELPSKFRLIAYKIIDDDDDSSAPMSYLLDETDFGIVKNYLDIFIQLSLLLLQEDRNDDLYEFFNRFLRNAGATFEGDIVFEYVWSVCSTIMQNPNVINRQLSLFLLFTIADTQMTALTNHINDVMHFILDWSPNDDELDYIALCRLLEELAENIPVSLSSFIDPISIIILKKISHQKSLHTLDIVLEASSRPPDRLPDFIQSLLQLLPNANPQQTEEIFSCIGSSISCFDDTIEDIYQALCPILNTALSNGDLKAVCLRCFGKLAAISPKSLQADIEKHVMLIVGSMQSESIKIVIEAIRCLKSIATNCIISLLPFFQNFFGSLINTLKQHPIKPLKGDADEDEIEIQEEIMTCIATLIKYVPNHIPPVAKEFKDQILKNCVYHNGRLHKAVCESIEIAAEGYKFLDMPDIFDTILPLIQDISKSDMKEVIIEIHRAISAIIKTFGSDFIVPRLNDIKQPILGGLSGLYTAYLAYELSPSIDIHLLAPIFECLDRMIGALGQNATYYVDEIYEGLKSYLPNQNKAYVVYPLEIFAHLCFLSPEFEDLFGLTIERCVLFLNDGNKVLQTQVTKAIRYLLYANKNGLESYQQMLIEFCENIIKSNIDYVSLKDSATSLWCGLVMEFGLVPNQEILQIVINNFPPKFDSDDLPFASVFAVFAAKEWPELATPKVQFVAARLLSSDDYYITETAESVVAVLASSLQQVPEDDLAGLVQFNQGRQIRLLANLQRFKPSE